MQVLCYTKYLQTLPNPPTGNQIVRFYVAYLRDCQITVSFLAVSQHKFINKQLGPWCRVFLDDISSAHRVKYLHSLGNHTSYPSSYQKGAFTTGMHDKGLKLFTAFPLGSLKYNIVLPYVI